MLLLDLAPEHFEPVVSRQLISHPRTIAYIFFQILRNLCTPRSSIGWLSVNVSIHMLVYTPPIWQLVYQPTLNYKLTCWLIHVKYTGRPSDDTGSVNCQWNIARLSVERRLTISVISVDCHLKYKLGSWVSVLRARYCGSGFENSFLSVVCAIPCHVNLLDFCCCSTHVVMLDCRWIPLKGNAIMAPIFFQKKSHTHLILSH